MRILLLPLALILAGCSSDRTTPAAAYAKWTDRLIVSMGLESIIGTSCWVKEETTEFGDVYGFVGNDRCYRFNPPERIEGVWIDEYEAQGFLTQAQYDAGVRDPIRDHVWLEFVGTPRPEPRVADGEMQSRAYRIVFTGRRAKYPGAYGHMGGSTGLVLVDKLISLEEIKGD